MRRVSAPNFFRPEERSSRPTDSPVREVSVGIFRPEVASVVAEPWTRKLTDPLVVEEPWTRKLTVPLVVEEPRTHKLTVP